MAVDSLTLASCGGEMGTGHGGGDDQPAVRGGDGTDAVVYKKGAWSKEEDEKLIRAVDEYGLRNWVTIEKLSGLARPAKNCRLRWLNYLRPNLKKYPFTEEEERLILHLHAKYGNSWSRIAAKLPGRSDNEIKNFWHKRAKKCQKHHLPIYPQEIHQTQTNIADKNHDDNDDCFFSNNGDFLAQNAYHSTDVSSSNPFVNSPQTPISISTPQSQFLSSPSSLVTSQKQSPTNDQNTPSSNPFVNSPQTPISISNAQSQFLSSPSSLVTSQKQSPTNDQNTPTSQTQNLLVSPLQTIETPLDFTTLRKPPILSSPQSTLRRFSRSHSLVADSSSQMQWSSSTLVSPVEREDSPMASFPALQLKSPTTAPLSPLQLRLSMPVPSESTQPMIVDTDHFVANNSSPTLQNHPSFKFCQQGGVNSGRVDKVEESESNLDIMEELKEAQERVRFLKRKLKERRISENRSLLTESSRNKNLVGENRVHSPLKNSTKKELLKRILKRKGDMGGVSQVKSARNKGEDLEIVICGQGIVESEKVAQSENAEILQIKEDTLSEIFERENCSTFNEQSHWIDLLDHINSQNTGKCSNECSTIEDLLSESSTLFQDSFWKRGVFGQSTETTLVKPGYLQGEQFGYSIGQDVDTNLDVKSIFCEPNLIPNQYHAPDQLDSSYLLSQPIMENDSCYLFSQQMMKQESSGGEQFYLQQEPCPQQSLLGGSAFENLWKQEQMVSQDQTLSTQRFDSLVDPVESKNWNYETGEVLLKEEQEHENMDIIMPDDLSSLLEFFPTNNQTLEWYNIGDAITDTEAVHESDKSSTSQPLISIADYI